MISILLCFRIVKLVTAVIILQNLMKVTALHLYTVYYASIY